MTFITHCLIYYLSGQMPLIRIFDADNNTGEVINDLFEQVSQEKERTFQVGTHTFRAYITSTQSFKLSNGAYLYLANSYTADRNKKIYYSKIQPDILTSKATNVEDEDINEAKLWINN
ncbi:MAG TPA: hypothetical protein VF974_04170 [Patescibacteria group bacterium]